MKKSEKLLLSVTAIAAISLITYAIRRHNYNRRHARVADEGYETAHDILYPNKKAGGRKLQYGPVLPE